MTDSTNEGDETTEPTCRSCGGRIVETDLQRIVPRIEDEQAVYLRFCGDDCLEEWRASEEFAEWRSSA